ncbi:MAG: MoaD/ThiS family protein [Flavobacterium sp.]|nr:MAG: MoaD/ThiS family protein [Flavobacterium sp.]
MAVKIIAFGQIAEITGKKFETSSPDTEMLKSWLFQKFPALETKKFLIAVNKRIITDTINLEDNDEVALMPPYSGG